MGIDSGSASIPLPFPWAEGLVEPPNAAKPSANSNNPPPTTRLTDVDNFTLCSFHVVGPISSEGAFYPCEDIFPTCF
jgi:hypothetical protein